MYIVFCTIFIICIYPLLLSWMLIKTVVAFHRRRQSQLVSLASIPPRGACRISPAYEFPAPMSQYQITTCHFSAATSPGSSREPTASATIPQQLDWFWARRGGWWAPTTDSLQESGGAGQLSVASYPLVLSWFSRCVVLAARARMWTCSLDSYISANFQSAHETTM